jgi:hypothetical protein
MVLVVLLLVLVLLAGCGSSQSGGDASKRSVAGVEAAARRFVANVQGAHYPEACAMFTAQSQAILKREEPGGCLGTIAYLYAALSGQVNKWFQGVLPRLEVAGNVARTRTCVPKTGKCLEKVYARYEHGQWHIETAIL